MRALTFAAVVIIAFVGPWWLLCVAAPVYAFRYTARELLLVGFALDLSYGVSGDAFGIWYTLAFAILLMLMAVVKPRLTLTAHAPL